MVDEDLTIIYHSINKCDEASFTFEDPYQDCVAGVFPQPPSMITIFITVSRARKSLEVGG
jgi:hypothetical protein